MANVRQVSKQEFEKLKFQYGFSDDEQAKAILKVEPTENTWQTPNDAQVEDKESVADKFEPVLTEFSPPKFVEDEKIEVGEFSADETSINKEVPQFENTSVAENITKEDVDAPEFDTNAMADTNFSFDAPEVPNFEFEAPEFNMDAKDDIPTFETPDVEIAVDNKEGQQFSDLDKSPAPITEPETIQKFDALETVESNIANEFTNVKNISESKFEVPNLQDTSIKNVAQEKTQDDKDIEEEIATEEEEDRYNEARNNMMKDGTRKLWAKMEEESIIPKRSYENSK